MLADRRDFIRLTLASAGTGFGLAGRAAASQRNEPNSDTSDHQHGVSESFYVLEGELDHVGNSTRVKLSPGMVGSVRPPDVVRHRTGAAGARALVIWAPGGQIARVTSRWRARKG